MIRRFDFNTMTFSNMRGNDVIRSIEMSSEGNFVKYDDHIAEIAALRVKLEKETARLDWIIDNRTGNGGGNGFEIKVWVPVDSECVRGAIDEVLSKGKAS